MTLVTSPRLPRRIFRFGLVGIANTAIDLVLFWALEPSLGVLRANLLSTSAGMAFSFWMNGRHTFGASRLTMRQAAAFVATNAFSLWLMQPVVIVAVHDITAVSLALAKPAALGSSMLTNFLLYRYVVWRPTVVSRRAPEGPPQPPVVEEVAQRPSRNHPGTALNPSPQPAGLAAAREAARR